MQCRRFLLGFLTWIVVPLANSYLMADEFGSVEEELANVRECGDELYTRTSSVFGQLPGPAEMAAHQLRCRPIPAPQAGVKRERDFNDATKRRAAGLDPAELRRAPGRLQMTVLPLGITGAYVVEAQGKQELLVVHVLDDTPAAGALRLDDIIIGANGRIFTDPEDPRPEMGNALCESQSQQLGGMLTLHIVRDRRPLTVKLNLGSTLSFSDTYPYNCEKTRQVREAALRFVVDSHPWHRYNFWTPLFLMASGDDEALELARRHLCAGLEDKYEPGTGGSAWVGGYRLTNLCEYYLLTGDSSVLPAIRHQAEEVAWAQYRSGSWSHGAGLGPNVPEPGTAGGGYGEVNNAGLGALIGLCLARQCGIQPFDHTIPRSIRFFGPFCGENIGYGLGTPSDSRTGRMDNGMNGMSAIVFHLLGEQEMAERWARSVCYMWMGRERGHAEAIFSAAWGPVSADLAPKPEFHAFMNQLKWAYEMGRARDGGLSFMRGSRWTYPNMTAAYGLFLYLPEKRLQVLGGDSVFAQAPPKDLVSAAQLYKDKQWEELTKFLDAYLKRPHSQEEKAYANKLLAAYERLEDHAHATVKMIEKNIAEGNLQTASVQLDLLAKLMGRDLPTAARLRAKLPADADTPRDAAPRAKRAPLIDANKIINDLTLARGGIRDGWAHSPAYIKQTNMQGFEGMSAEQIAPFVGHFSGGVSDGAIEALAGRGEEALPLLKRMLGDSHPGIRSGAVDTLTRIYASGISEHRTEVPENLEQIIRLVRPMLDDESILVRNAVSGFVINIKVVNEDIYEMIHKLALQGGNVHNFVRHVVKEPEVRTRLGMAIIDYNNKARITSPGTYIPMICITTSHLEKCQPYMQTAIDTINNPEVQIMYGFFSNHPEDAALHICSRFHEHPLVLENLPQIIRVSFRRGEPNVYWDVHREFPHRIAIQLGSKALPIIKEFWNEMAPRVRRIAAEQEEPPYWYQPKMAETLDENIAHWEDTAELIRCLNDVRPADQAVAGMVAHCLKDRWWSAWERARVWDKLIEMGPDILPQFRHSLATAIGPLEERLDQQIADLRGKIDTSEDRNEKRELERELQQLSERKAELSGKVEDLERLASLIESLHAKEPTADHVRGLCRFYLRPPYRPVYPYHKDGNLGYARPLHATQDQQVRDKLVDWGPKALPTVRQCLAEADESLDAKLKKLDEEIAYWKTQWSRKASGPLKRIAGERLALEQIRDELKDLTALIELQSQQQFSGKQLATLCSIYTRNDWPPQRELIRRLLTRHAAQARPIIAQHARDIQPTLAEAQDKVNGLMGNSVNVPFQYDYWKAKMGSIRSALAELREL